MSNQLNNDEKNCPKCRTENGASSTRCRTCGSKLPTYSNFVYDGGQIADNSQSAETATCHPDSLIEATDYLKVTSKSDE